MEFHFIDGDGDKKGKFVLHSIEILFRPSKQAEFYDSLVKVTSNKYGAAPPDDVAKKLMLWMNKDCAAAGIQFTGGAYEFIWTPPH